MRSSTLLALAGASATGSAHKLFVSSYSGLLSSLELEQEGQTYNLTSNFQNDGCGPDPTWLMVDHAHNILYCLGESAANLTANGSISSYVYGPQDGFLTQQNKQPTINGPVSALLFGAANNTAVALANYGGSAVSTFSVGTNLTLSALQNITIAPPSPAGPVAGSQTVARPHQAISDPTGQYILVPDLGKDLVHVFSHDASNMLTELAPLIAKNGSGPRHAAFWSPTNYRDAGGNSPLYMYLVAELDASITGFSVAYNANKTGLNFTQLFTADTLAGGKPNGKVAPAGIQLSPDNRFIVVGNRNDSSYTIPNHNPLNTTSEISDSLITYKPMNNGSLEFRQLAAAGGKFPRQFEISGEGDKVAVVLQTDGRVAILERDCETGLIGRVIAGLEVAGQPTCIVWG